LGHTDSSIAAVVRQLRTLRAVVRLSSLLLMLVVGNLSHSAVAAARKTESMLSGPSGLEAYLREEMRKRDIPGMQVAVVHHRRIVFQRSYGLANIQDQAPVDDRTVFSIASSTKAFTGVAVMQLVEEGLLDLDAPISKYVDDLPTAWRAVTVKQLATFTSGLPDVWDSGAGHLIVDNGDETEAWVKVQTLPMQFDPGSRVRYTQTNYLLLSRAIEKVSGVPYTDFVTQRQFKVVGMTHTAQAGFGGSRDIIIHSARPYTSLRSVHDEWISTEKLENAIDVNPKMIYSATGIYATTHELAEWIIALQTGRLLNPTSLKILWTPATLNDGSRGRWGIGWPVVERPEHPAVQPTGGVRGALAIYTDDDLAVVILTNLQGAEPEQMLDEVAAYYVPEMHRELKDSKP